MFMSFVQEPFIIAYYGVSVKVTPIVKDTDIQYVVRLPTRTVRIETEFDENELHYWQEIPGGRTELAQEIGQIIEERDM